MNNAENNAERLKKARQIIKDNSLSALIISSKDDFLNEYVDKEMSPRIFVSGFTGTAGDLLITANEAYIMVDGRYHTQADNQVNKELFKVEKVGIDENNNRINELIPDRLAKVIKKLSTGKNFVIGYDPYQFGVKTLEYIRDKIQEESSTTTFTALFKPLVEEFFGSKIVSKNASVNYIPIEVCGLTPLEKVNIVRDKLLSLSFNAFFVSKLDELAYLTNLRSNTIDYNSTFKGYALITLKNAFLFTDIQQLGCLNLKYLNDAFDVLPLNDMQEIMQNYIQKENNQYLLGYDPSSITCATLDKLNRLISKHCKIIPLEESPVRNIKALKNNAELNYIKTCFNKADNVFNDVINYINDLIKSEKFISELDIKLKVAETFKKYGANRLSFESICAAGPNSAVIHYTQSSRNIKIKKGDIVLIDAGGYFEAGYATDLTRTFIAGADQASATNFQKKLFTLILKAAIKGLNAEIPPGENGCYLDNIVRSVITEKGYDYNHGTGHGIGILVHESPPSISYGPGGNQKLEENMLFSIEPGIYLEGKIGIRIENIATLIKHPDKNKADLGWLKVQCLTFAPLDTNLINYDMLDESDIEYLQYFQKQFKNIEIN